MGRRLTIIPLFLLSAIQGIAQEKNTAMEDSTFQLEAVSVQGYSYNRAASDVPAAIAPLNIADLQRFANMSLVPALNQVPGVRMEERSPGSYRLAIRGSSLRSPFGVRNVKVYWNGVPFTDAGGNTYLNLFDFNAIGNVEVIKGPASSNYGAGTGGVLLLKSLVPKKTSVGMNAVVGSDGILSYGMNANVKAQKGYISLQHYHLASDGYRNHTNTYRDVIQSQAGLLAGKNTFQLNFLYSDLTYQTPGGLTLQQFQQDPKQARPPGGPNRGAEEQHATVYNKSSHINLNHTYQCSDRWTTETGIYTSHTNFTNPTIRNYEQRTESGFGGRLDNEFSTEKIHINFGGEYQQSFSPINIYNNDLGIRGNQQSADEVRIRTYFAFAQIEVFLPASFSLTAGASLNKLQVDFTRLSAATEVHEERDFDPVFSPQLAVLKKFGEAVSLYASFSKGYSPPTVQELYPSTAVFDKNLDPEKGTNYEVGLRTKLLQRTLSVELIAYSFRMDETIAIRRQQDGAEYFVNAGKTLQNGIESRIEWNPRIERNALVDDLKIWTSITLNDYTFSNFKIAGPGGELIDLSGKSMTGTPSRIYVAGVDLELTQGFYLNATHSFTSKIALNDDHTQTSPSYSLLGGRLGFRNNGEKYTVDIFTGVDNALDEKYSLGNDLNAVGGRFFNAAARRNYFTGFKISRTLK